MYRKEVLPPFTGLELLEKRLAELKSALRIVKERQNPQLKRKLYISKSHGTYQFRLVHENEGESLQTVALANQNTYSVKRKIIPDKQPPATEYLSKAQTDLLHQYCQKEYDEKLICVLQEQIFKLEKLKRIVNQNPSENAMTKLPEAKRTYIIPVTLPPVEYAAAWKNVYYRKKGFYPSAPQFITANGDHVRSKSETIIADTLTRQKIPYRYEYPVKLNINGKLKTFHPDFYCLNLRTRHEFIWEHFGLLDDTDYAENVAQKIEIYHENGYFEGVNLLYTIETENTPLTTKHIEQIAKKFLL